MYIKKLTSTPQIHPSLPPRIPYLKKKNDFLERASEGKP